MAVLFISHSSKDDGHATALEAWLRANSFTDIFVDHQSIMGGEKWSEALKSSAGACRVVICLVTYNWLNSKECPHEFRAAWYMGKRIVPLFLLGDIRGLDQEARDWLAKIQAEDQGLDLAPCLRPDGSLWTSPVKVEGFSDSLGRSGERDGQTTTYSTTGLRRCF